MNIEPLTHGDYDFSSDPFRTKMLQNAVAQTPPGAPGDTVETSPGNPWAPVISSTSEPGSGSTDVTTNQTPAQGLYGANSSSNTPPQGNGDGTDAGLQKSGDALSNADAKKLLALLRSVLQQPNTMADDSKANCGSTPLPGTAQKTCPPAKAPIQAKTSVPSSAPASAPAAPQPSKPGHPGAPGPTNTSNHGSAGFPGAAGGTASQTTQPPSSSQSVSAGALLPAIPGMGIDGTAVRWGDPATAAAINDERGNGFTKGSLSY